MHNRRKLPVEDLRLKLNRMREEKAYLEGIDPPPDPGYNYLKDSSRDEAYYRNRGRGHNHHPSRRGSRNYYDQEGQYRRQEPNKDLQFHTELTRGKPVNIKVEVQRESGQKTYSIDKNETFDYKSTRGSRGVFSRGRNYNNVGGERDVHGGERGRGRGRSNFRGRPMRRGRGRGRGSYRGSRTYKNSREADDEKKEEKGESKSEESKDGEAATSKVEDHGNKQFEGSNYHEGDYHEDKELEGADYREGEYHEDEYYGDEEYNGAGEDYHTEDTDYHHGEEQYDGDLEYHRDNDEYNPEVATVSSGMNLLENDGKENEQISNITTKKENITRNENIIKDDSNIVVSIKEGTKEIKVDEIKVEGKESAVKPETKESAVKLETKEKAVKVDAKDTEVKVNAKETEVKIGTIEPEIKVKATEPKVNAVEKEMEAKKVDEASQPSESKLEEKVKHNEKNENKGPSE